MSNVSSTQQTSKFRQHTLELIKESLDKWEHRHDTEAPFILLRFVMSQTNTKKKMAVLDLDGADQAVAVQPPDSSIKESNVDVLSPKKANSSDLPLHFKYKHQIKISKDAGQYKSSPRPLSGRIQIQLPKIEENPSLPNDGCRTVKSGEVQTSPSAVSRATDANTPSTVEAGTDEHTDARDSPVPFLFPGRPTSGSTHDSEGDEDESSAIETPRSLTYDQLRAYQRPFTPETGARSFPAPSSRPSNVPALRIRRALPASAKPDIGAALREELAHCRDTLAASAGNAGRAINDAGAALGRFAENLPHEISNNPLLRRWARRRLRRRAARPLPR